MPEPFTHARRRTGLLAFLIALCVADFGCAGDVTEIGASRKNSAGAWILTTANVENEPPPKDLAPLVRRLQAARRIWSVGSPDGREETSWGLPVDAMSDSHGRIFVLDQMNSVIRVFAADGQYLGSFLRNGRGPLEMRQPVGIEITRGDSLLVYSTSEVRVVAAAATDRVVEARSFPQPSPALDLCAGDMGLFTRIAPLGEEGTVQRVDFDGKPTIEFCPSSTCSARP